MREKRGLGGTGASVGGATSTVPCTAAPNGEEEVDVEGIAPKEEENVEEEAEGKEVEDDAEGGTAVAS